MTADEMRELRGKMTQRDFGRCIGKSLRNIQRYEGGYPIQKTVEMACVAFKFGLFKYDAAALDEMTLLH